VPRARRVECWLPATDGGMRLVHDAVDAGHGTVLPLRRTG
jgi:hypothetical protein